MKLSEKISMLRKSRQMSQEELSEQLHVSRQTVSRWETGSAMPDASNLLQLSELFHVSADYLLQDDHPPEQPPSATVSPVSSSWKVLFFLISLEVMVLLIQFITTVFLKNAFFALSSFLLFAAIIAGFEFAYRKEGTEDSAAFRRRFYQISAYLGFYFPIRFLMRSAVVLFSISTTALVFEPVVLTVYLAAATYGALSLEKGKK